MSKQTTDFGAGVIPQNPLRIEFGKVTCRECSSFIGLVQGTEMPQPPMCCDGMRPCAAMVALGAEPRNPLPVRPRVRLTEDELAKMNPFAKSEPNL